MTDTEDVFTKIFDEHIWKGQVRSGPGSTLAVTELAREGLLAAFSDLDITSLCDAPCGDGTWIFEITADLDQYYGVDIVKELIDLNQQRDLPDNHTFFHRDITTEALPKADAILCRDCLVHLSLELALSALQNFAASGAKYLITTTFPSLQTNIDARVGSWRPISLMRPPFSLPEPIRFIRERAPNPDDNYNDKSLGIWDMQAIKAIL
ncbi:MAG: class I SAM-dependent methyltransferase [Pseudomonadota bacterium]